MLFFLQTNQPPFSRGTAIVFIWHGRTRRMSNDMHYQHQHQVFRAQRTGL